MRVIPLSALVLSLVPLCGCSASTPRPAAPSGAVAETREARPTEAIATSGRVGLTSFALAGRVTAEGARAAFGAASGLVTGGIRGAETRWNDGTDRTRDVARHEAEAVREAAVAPAE